MSEYKEKKMKQYYGFFDEETMTENPLCGIAELGLPVRIHDGRGYGSAPGWLVGESENFKENGCYDVIEPDHGMRTVHWDYLRPVEAK